jgi:hypothetical protein
MPTGLTANIIAPLPPIPPAAINVLPSIINPVVVIPVPNASAPVGYGNSSNNSAAPSDNDNSNNNSPVAGVVRANTDETGKNNQPVVISNGKSCVSFGLGIEVCT